MHNDKSEYLLLASCLITKQALKMESKLNRCPLSGRLPAASPQGSAGHQLGAAAFRHD